ncbi:DMT family transporter [Streptomyces sp. NPDC052236]|uniref:DMT family transporter n=1 Tax=Streptomyces sp. NPDC052236 TaxID=3365686 RepID=UPI0037D959DF
MSADRTDWIANVTGQAWFGGAVAIGLSVLSALAYAVAAVRQERVASRVRSAPSVSSVRRTGWAATFTSSAWWLAVALNGVGALLHVIALRYGSLTLVQPLGALTLVLALPLGARWARRRVSADERRGVVLTLTGLAGVLLLTATQDGIGALTASQVDRVLVATALLLAALCATAFTYAVRRPTVHALLLATASGVAFGMGSVLSQTVAVRVSAAGVGELLGVSTLAVVALSVGGLLLSQSAYRSGGLGAPLATVTLVNPLAAAAVGLTLLGQGFAAGTAGIAVAVASLGFVAAGVVLLTRPAAAPSSVVPLQRRAGNRQLPPGFGAAA